jgi:hypothetical protein
MNDKHSKQTAFWRSLLDNRTTSRNTEYPMPTSLRPCRDLLKERFRERDTASQGWISLLNTCEMSLQGRTSGVPHSVKVLSSTIFANPKSAILR